MFRPSVASFPACFRAVSVHGAPLVLSLALLALFALGACRVEENAPDPEPAMPRADAGNGGVPGGECKDPWARGFAANSCTMADGGAPPIEPLDWPDVCNPGTFGWTPVQESFDQLSWRSFLWESWPADPDGQPDASQPIGIAQDGDFPEVVWERYVDASVLFGSGAADLTAEDFETAASAVPSGCDAGGPRALSMTSKVPPETIQAVRRVLEAGGGGAAEGETLEGLQSIDQAFTGPLYPQGPEGPSGLWPVFYEIRINDIEFQSIVSAGAQNKSPDQLNCKNLLGCTPFSFEMGSTEIKAAWKVLTDDELTSGRFFHQDLQVVDPVSGQCSVQPMGLVGLHIARKVKAAVIGPDLRKNTWAWATFEQVDNTPPVGETTGTYTFFDGECTPVVDAATCAAVTTPDPDPALQCCPNLYRYAGGTVPTDPTPDQVTRIDESPAGTVSCNDVYDPLEKGVFDHYTLVATQWPQAVEGQGVPTVTPAHSRNAVIETYFTKWQNGQQVNTSSCMGCHSGSQAVDMSYLFLGNTGGGG